MDDKSTTRLIGDFLELNADILSNQFNSKYPKFIANLQAKYYRNKLIKSANKLKKSNFILNTDNLVELFIYIYNNYEGNYGCINKILINLNNYNNSIIDTEIVIDNIKAHINIDTSNPKMTINGVIIKDKINHSFNINTYELKSNKPVSSEVIPIINKKLLEDLSNYILEIIGNYSNKERKGYVKKQI
jgi:hypothetical protein